MLAEENELLTRTGPGTACGELMRRYWQPVALAEELPAGGASVPITLLGEELVLFRDDRGRIGLIDAHCAHRGADLSFGRLEDGGLRCIYHGWLYDVNGKIIDMPGEVEGGKGFRESICQKAYPVEERAGVIFTYMGPREPPRFPELPVSQRSGLTAPLPSSSIANAITSRATRVISISRIFLFCIITTTHSIVTASVQKLDRLNPRGAGSRQRILRRRINRLRRAKLQDLARRKARLLSSLRYRVRSAQL